MLRPKRKWYWAIVLVLVAIALTLWLAPFPWGAVSGQPWAPGAGRV